MWRIWVIFATLTILLRVHDAHLTAGINQYEAVEFIERKVEKLNDRPIIGILTEEYDVGPEAFRVHGNKKDNDPDEYVVASYVKFVESAGARVVAIRYKESRSRIFALLDKLNGVLLPGGGMEIKKGTHFHRAGKAIWDYANKHKDFPVFGTCLGMEFLTVLQADDDRIIHEDAPFNASDLTSSLHFTRAAKSSRLFSGIFDHPSRVTKLETEKLTYNQHELGITPRVFMKNKGLSRNFNILATSFDKSGKEFVTAFEHRELNIFGIQFHPEKSVFEWFPGASIPHEPEAIFLAHHLASVFVQAARKNSNSFHVSPGDEAKFLIQNDERRYLGNFYFEEIFVFYENEPQRGLPELIDSFNEPLKTIEY